MNKEIRIYIQKKVAENEHEIEKLTQYIIMELQNKNYYLVQNSLIDLNTEIDILRMHRKHT